MEILQAFQWLLPCGSDGPCLCPSFRQMHCHGPLDRKQGVSKTRLASGPAPYPAPRIYCKSFDGPFGRASAIQHTNCASFVVKGIFQPEKQLFAKLIHGFRRLMTNRSIILSPLVKPKKSGWDAEKSDTYR